MIVVSTRAALWRALCVVALASKALAANLSAGGLVVRVIAHPSSRVRGAAALATSAVRHYRFSLVCTALSATAIASLAGVAAPLVVASWLIAWLVSLAGVRALEPLILRQLGCRPPSRLERERLQAVLVGDRSGDGAEVGAARVGILVLDVPQPWLGRGFRSVVLSRALLDLLEDRALAGLLTQAIMQVRTGGQAGELCVWLGNLPLLVASALSRSLVQMGTILGVELGGALVLPLLMWPAGFTRWAGRIFGAMCVALLGATLLSSGLSAAGVSLLVAWVLVPGLESLVNWETRRLETAVDDATFESGLAWELVEALETLCWAESVPPPAAPLGWLCRTAVPLADRADRLWRKLSAEEKGEPM